MNIDEIEINSSMPTFTARAYDYFDDKIMHYAEINQSKITIDTTALNNSSDWKQIIDFFENTSLISSVNEENFVVNFHVLYMFIKKLSLCEEYRDLNTRHLYSQNNIAA